MEVSAAATYVLELDELGCEALPCDDSGMLELEEILDDELICPAEPLDEEDMLMLYTCRLTFLPRLPSRLPLSDRISETFLSGASRTRGSYSA